MNIVYTIHTNVNTLKILHIYGRILRFTLHVVIKSVLLVKIIKASRNLGITTQ